MYVTKSFLGIVTTEYLGTKLYEFKTELDKKISDLDNKFIFVSLAPVGFVL